MTTSKSHYFITALILTSTITSCNSTKTKSQSQGETSQGLSQTPLSQSVSLPDKAETVCGDRSPTDPKSYPVNFYPVSVEYSDKNLELVQKHFCEDAIKIKSKSLGKEVVQVASFTSQEKANSFKEKLSQHFSQATIGEPTIVEKPKSDVGDRKPGDENSDTVESIAKSALLNSEQVKQLLDLEESRQFYPKGGDGGREIGKVKALVPTYIPSGFNLVEFSRISPNPESQYDMRYRLRYKSSNGEAFDIANFEMMGDGPAFTSDLGRLDHPLLGKIRLWGSWRDKVDGDGELSFQVPYTLCYRGEPTGYYFYSGKNSGIGQVISIQEAVKIVNSLKPLNPKTKFDSLPGKAKWGVNLDFIGKCESDS
jgi:hypothetical protein